MPIIIFDEFDRHQPKGCRMSKCRKYGFWNFFWDVTLTCLTGGFWLIWIFIRESRMKNS